MIHNVVAYTYTAHQISIFVEQSSNSFQTLCILRSILASSFLHDVHMTLRGDKLRKNLNSDPIKTRRMRTLNTSHLDIGERQLEGHVLDPQKRVVWFSDHEPLKIAGRLRHTVLK